MKHNLFLIGALLLLLAIPSCNKQDQAQQAQFYSLSVKQKSLILIEGESFQLDVEKFVMGNGAYTLNWTSDNEEVAAVDANGLVTAVKKGKAHIVLSLEGGTLSDECEIVVYDLRDLSATAYGSANCYIISDNGAYRFKTVKGNSSTSVGAVASAELLWKTYQTASPSNVPKDDELITRVFYADDYITVCTDSKEEMKNGNAVVVAKDADGKILWSWHLWVSKDYNPFSSSQNYSNSAGRLMDRNLGALGTQMTDYRSYGMMYQWGRKDPFPGSAQSKSETTAKTTREWQEDYSTPETGTIEWATAHPGVFLRGCVNNYDWLYSDDKTTDDERWGSIKTIYDPCPPGWRVPDGGEVGVGVWAKACGKNTLYQSETISETYGQYYYWRDIGAELGGVLGSDATIWYPAAGYREYDTVLKNVGSSGHYWSCTISNADGVNWPMAYEMSIGSSRIYTAFNHYLAAGFSVRCMQE